jgi:hypothetical protein
VPTVAAGYLPSADELLARRDFSGGTAPSAPADHGYEWQPVVAVLGTFADWPMEQVRAGVGLQRVLLTATIRQLGVSLFSAPLEVPALREEVRGLLGDPWQPQMVMRIGHGRPLPPVPRRPTASSRL